MARATQQFVYQLPTPVAGRCTSVIEQRWSEVAVWFTPDGWVAEVRGEEFSVGSRLGVTGRERTVSLRGPVSAVVREGDRMVPGFVLAALGAAEAAGMGRVA